MPSPAVGSFLSLVKCGRAPLQFVVYTDLLSRFLHPSRHSEHSRALTVRDPDLFSENSNFFFQNVIGLSSLSRMWHCH